MGKLGTQFTPITNPANTRLITLIDESTGLRYRISIEDFFEIVATGVTFTANITRKSNDAGINPSLVSENDEGEQTLIFTGRGGGAVAGVTVIQNIQNKNVRIEGSAKLQVVNLGGTGTRNVVVDALGVMSAP